MNTHKVLQSGFVNTLLMAHLVMKIAVIPAAQASSIVVLPVIGTAIMGTLGAFVFLYAANQVYKATKGVIWSGLSFVANKFDEQLNQNLLGRGIKQLFGPLVSSAVSYMAEKPVGETTSGVATTAEDSQGTVLGNTVRVGFLGALGVAGFYLYSKSTANA
jgi:predicted membrane metal-binding protein